MHEANQLHISLCVAAASCDALLLPLPLLVVLCCCCQWSRLHEGAGRAAELAMKAGAWGAQCAPVSPSTAVASPS